MIVLLLDAYNLLYRSFTSLPPAIVDRDGQPINAVYGLVASVIRLIRDLQPTHLVAAFDVPESPTFRHRMYGGYQAQRGPLGGDRSDDFLRQARIAQEALPRVGVAALAEPGYEADDIMGTLARAISAAEGRAIIVSTDRDLLQLVGSGVEVLVPGSKPARVSDADGVRARVGVPPEAVTTFKALAGDPSDNIPGLPGIGPKTAASLIAHYGTLDGIFANLSALPPRVAATLEAGREAAMTFRTLATIVTDLPLPLSPGSLPRPTFDSSTQLAVVLDRMGCPRPGREDASNAGTPGGIRTPDL